MPKKTKKKPVAKSSNSNLMGLREYARHRGVELAPVQQAINAGKIDYVLVNGAKKIDPTIADKTWEIVGKETGMTGAQSLSEKKQHGQDIQNRLKELELKKKLGELVDAEEVKKESAKIALGLRDTLLRLPSSIAAELAVETDPNAVERMLTKEIRYILVEYCDRKLGVDTPDGSKNKTVPTKS